MLHSTGVPLNHETVTSSDSANLSNVALNARVEISLDEVSKVVERALKRLGHEESDVPIIRDILMYAELRSGSQGLVKLTIPGLAKDPRALPWKIEQESESSARINANFYPAMVVLHHASILAAKKAAAAGIAVIGTYGSHQSTGAAGYYADLIAKSGCIGLVFCGTPAFVAPYGASERCFGTNPIALGVPAGGINIVSDITTSSTAFFEALLAKERGIPLPPGRAFDRSGVATTDPAAAMEGAFTPLDGGTRGSALGWNTSVLTGPFVGASINRSQIKNENWGNLVLALRQDLFVASNLFLNAVGELRNEVKSKRPLKPGQEVLVPGERGDRLVEEAIKRGTLMISRAIWEKVCAVAS